MLVSMACSALAQPENSTPKPPAPDTPAARFHFGVFGGFGPALHTTDLTIPGYGPDCARLRSGEGMTWGGGLLAEFTLAPLLSLQARVGAGFHRGSLSQRYSGDPIGRSDGIIVTATVDQIVEFDAIDNEYMLLARSTIGGRLTAQAGLLAGFGIASTETHKQAAVEPDDLLLSNNKRELVLQSGLLYRRAGFTAGLAVGLAYDLPISSTSALSPEVMALIPLGNRTPDGAWRWYALRAGAALRFGIRPQPPVIAPPPLPDTPIVRSPTLVTSVVAEPRVVAVRIDEYDSSEVLPLLNQVFFAETSAELRREYRRLTPAETPGFTNAKLLGSALDVYYHLLNIVGRRLREMPEATMTINGYRNGREPDAALALARAETIKRYLVDVWKIPERRLRTKAGNAPPNPARENSREGFEENSRAELIPSDPNLLAPILRRHVQRLATPPAITFYPNVLAEAGVESWRLETEERGKGVWRTFSGYRELPDSIVWDWRSDSGELPVIPMQLSYRFTVTDLAGRTTTTDLVDIDVDYQSVRSKLERRDNDTVIESYSILLFNFDSPKVGASDQELLRVIGEAVRAQARVRIAGFTDSLGEENHNRDLATSRAREVERIFNRMVPRSVRLEVDEAAGGERERFPYDTPEGRSHCRTVIIDVRTPSNRE